MPRKPWNDSNEWTYELMHKIHGKVVKFGYTDGIAGDDVVIGIATIYDNAIKVTTKNGIDEWVGTPCQIYASSVRNWK